MANGFNIFSVYCFAVPSFCRWTFVLARRDTKVKSLKTIFSYDRRSLLLCWQTNHFSCCITSAEDPRWPRRLTRARWPHNGHTTTRCVCILSFREACENPVQASYRLKFDARLFEIFLFWEVKKEHSVSSTHLSCTVTSNRRASKLKRQPAWPGVLK